MVFAFFTYNQGEPMQLPHVASLHESAVQQVARDGVPDFGPATRNSRGHRTSSPRNLKVDRRVWAAVQQACRTSKRRIQIVSETEVWLF